MLLDFFKPSNDWMKTYELRTEPFIKEAKKNMYSVGIRYQYSEDRKEEVAVEVKNKKEAVELREKLKKMMVDVVDVESYKRKMADCRLMLTTFKRGK